MVSAVDADTTLAQRMSPAERRKLQNRLAQRKFRRAWLPSFRSGGWELRPLVGASKPEKKAQQQQLAEAGAAHGTRGEENESEGNSDLDWLPEVQAAVSAPCLAAGTAPHPVPYEVNPLARFPAGIASSTQDSPQRRRPGEVRTGEALSQVLKMPKLGDTLPRPRRGIWHCLRLRELPPTAPGVPETHTLGHYICMRAKPAWSCCRPAEIGFEHWHR